MSLTRWADVCAHIGVHMLPSHRQGGAAASHHYVPHTHWQLHSCDSCTAVTAVAQSALVVHSQAAQQTMQYCHITLTGKAMSAVGINKNQQNLDSIISQSDKQHADFPQRLLVADETCASKHVLAHNGNRTTRPALWNHNPSAPSTLTKKSSQPSEVTNRSQQQGPIIGLDEVVEGQCPQAFAFNCHGTGQATPGPSSSTIR